MQFFHSVSDICAEYDAFIVDLWGVIHDGTQTYSGAIDCLNMLHREGKQVHFLSNAPRRLSVSENALGALGIPGDLYQSLTTSGHVVRECMRRKVFDDFGNVFYAISPEHEDSLLDDIGYARTQDVNEADFLLAIGFKDEHSTLEDAMPAIQVGLKKELPMLCANPDKIVVRIDGTKAICAGLAAEAYAHAGGYVQFIGKPFDHVYDYVMDEIGNDTPRNRIAVIGDNLETDIMGALYQELDSYLITGGILTSQLGLKKEEYPHEALIKEQCEELEIFPTGILPAFV